MEETLLLNQQKKKRKAVSLRSWHSPVALSRIFLRSQKFLLITFGKASTSVFQYVVRELVLGAE